MSIWSNGIKCKYMFMFPLKIFIILACKGLIVYAVEAWLPWVYEDGQCLGCWCPGSRHCQPISSHVIDWEMLSSLRGNLEQPAMFQCEGVILKNVIERSIWQKISLGPGKGWARKRALTLKHWETHGCVVSTVATDALVLKHQAISIHNAD